MFWTGTYEKGKFYYFIFNNMDKNTETLKSQFN